ncbi:hypothetical protein [Brucella intermedia]|uniref:hypothetical protein n=1 Tax=Brucella intermedia TaxID=94625 RepID=UPI001AEDA0F9|nr:hypothetical protein [Brucella intermedia]
MRKPAYPSIVEARKAAEAREGSLREAVKMGLKMKRDLENKKNDRAQAEDLSHAARDVLAERRRQIDEENFRAADDDNYVNGSLAAAASCYAMAAARKNCLGWEPVGWPWHYSWWKPTTARRDLVKAGALIIAEIERLDRLSAPSEGAE